jgi:hypothetical protein
MFVRDNDRLRGGDLLPSPVRWQSVFAGAVVGVAVIVLLGSLWLAVATDWSWEARNFQWFQMASALFAWMLGGVLAGWLVRSRGVGMGLTHGVVVWAVILVARSVIAIPAGFGAVRMALVGASGAGQWASFGAIAGGLVAAAIGGLIGGGLPTPRWALRDEGPVDLRDDGARSQAPPTTGAPTASTPTTAPSR